MLTEYKSIPPHILSEISGAIEDGAEVSLLNPFSEEENALIAKYKDGDAQIFSWFGQDGAEDYQLITLRKKQVKNLFKKLDK